MDIQTVEKMTCSSDPGDSPLQRNLWRAIGLLKVVGFDHFERMGCIHPKYMKKITDCDHFFLQMDHSNKNQAIGRGIYR